MIIHTFGDGFLHPHLFLKWPQILKLLCNDITVKNHAAIGAGNEWIANQVLEQDLNSTDLYLIQWTASNRHDFLLTENLKKVIITDPIYKDNIYENWWCSSESKTKFLLTLKEHYNSHQMKLRTLSQILMIQNLLDNLNINYKFLTTYDIDWLTDHPSEKFLNWDKWIWHEKFKGMDAYCNRFRRSSKYAQPTPYIQYRWITDVMKPNLDLDWQEDKVKSVGETLRTTESKYH